VSAPSLDALTCMPWWDLDDGPDWDAEFDWMVDFDLRLSIEESLAPAMATYPIPGGAS
jgi:hypothetical protein